MLENLKTIRWEDLSTAYGTAEEVPDLIRSLTSSDPEEWDEALFTLEMGILHQDCDVTDATAASLPFLLEIVSSHSSPSRIFVLQFIGRAVRIAVEQSHWHSEEIFEKTYERFGQPITEENRQNLREDGESRRAVGAMNVHVALSMLGGIMSLMDDPNPAVRLHATWAAAQPLSCDAMQIAPNVKELHSKLFSEIHSRYRDEMFSSVRAGMLFALDVLAEAGSITDDQIREICSHPDGIAESLGAAIVLSKRAGKIAASDLSTLTQICIDLHKTEEAFSPEEFGKNRSHNPMSKAFHEYTGDRSLTYPWFENTLQETLLAHLTAIAGTCGDTIFPPMVALLRTYDRRSVPIALLDRIFPGLEIPEGKAFSELEPHQQEALHIVYENRRSWVEESNYIHDDTYRSGHARTFLKGMPPDRASMAAYLGLALNQDSALDMLIAAAFPWIESEADLGHPKRCAMVQKINLCGIADDEMLGLLSHFPKLKILSLDKLTEASVLKLSKISSLQTLSLIDPSLSDDDAPMFAGLNQLSNIYIRGSRITSTGSEILSDLLPSTNITVQP